jgi:hypothetical protein
VRMRLGVVLCGMLSVLTLFATSWGAAIRPRLPQNGTLLQTIETESGRPLLLLVDRRATWTCVEVGILTEGRIEEPGAAEDNQLPKWLRSLGPLYYRPSASNSWALEAFGFPLRAFACRWEESGDPPYERTTVWRDGGISVAVLRRSAANETPRRYDGALQPVLPIRPLWIGIGVNLLFWWLVFVGLWGGGLFALGTIRRHYGHCPRCGYDLEHNIPAGCVECGWGRDRGAPNVMTCGGV